MANTRVSDLTQGGVFAGTDIVYVVETPGSGGVYKDGDQLAEYIRDVVASFATAGSNIGIVHNDGADTLTFSFTGIIPADTDDLPEGASNLYFTDERVDDRVSALIQDGTGLTWTYVDGSGTFTGNVSLSAFDTDDLPEGATNLYLTAAEQTLIAGAVQTLSSATTYYVNKSGSDSNDGLSTGTAFLTIQKAIDTVASFNLGGLTHTISVDDGSAVTYAEALTLKPLTAGNCIIVGDETTPSNISIAPASGNVFTVAGGATGRWDIRGVEIDPVTTGLFLSGGFVALRNVEFAACTSRHVHATGNSNVLIDGAYEITGDAQAHFYATTGAVITCNSQTVTVTGTPAFSRAFAWAQSGGVIRAASNTYSGSATGKRYEASVGGLISTNGAAATYFPGNSAGTTATGGIYA